jgi:hypothetical protein
MAKERVYLDYSTDAQLKHWLEILEFLVDQNTKRGATAITIRDLIDFKDMIKKELKG